MSLFTRTTALTAAGALLTAPAVLIAAPAHADVERHGACGGGWYEFSVDREGRGFEVSLDLDRVKPGTKWNVALRHDGKRYFKRTLRADYEGDLDVERYRGNTQGKDAFKFRVSRVNGSATCTGKITVS